MCIISLLLAPNTVTTLAQERYLVRPVGTGLERLKTSSPPLSLRFTQDHITQDGNATSDSDGSRIPMAADGGSERFLHRPSVTA